MSQTIPETIANRVRKLLALAADARGNENEASVAAEMAQAILSEYNLTMTELGDAAPSSEEDVRVRKDSFAEVRQDWNIPLMAAVARNNFCSHWIEHTRDLHLNGSGKVGKRRRHVLIGRAVNVSVTVQVYEYLVSAMDRLCPYTDYRNRSVKSWYTGCVDRLSLRLDDKRREQEKASAARNQNASRGDGTSLVLADVYSSEEELNEDMRWHRAPGTTAARRRAGEEREREWIEEYKRTADQRRAAELARAEAEKAARENETLEERAKREKKEAAEAAREQARSERWRQSYQRRQERDAMKIDRTAYHAGRSAGEDIGLDAQVDEEKKKSLI